MREAGLPLLVADVHGDQGLLSGSKGVVRAIYPERWRIDLEAEDGSLLTEVLVIGPYFPEVHSDGDAPSHVGYLHFRGRAESFCWPMPHRRLLGPTDSAAGADGQSQPERRYFHTHGYIFRHGDVTVRLTDDNRYVIETEQGDYIILNTQERQIRLHAPTVFVGTDEEHNRIEYEQDESVRVFQPLVILGTETEDRIEYQNQAHVQVVTPQCTIGQTGEVDADGITYLANSMVHIVSELIKLTANDIVLDPVNIKLGNASATERVMLGDLFKSFLNTFLTLYMGHQHTGVQAGGGLSGPPSVGTPLMDDSMLSDVAKVSKTGL